MNEDKKIILKLSENMKEYEKHLLAHLCNYYDPYEREIDKIRKVIKETENYLGIINCPHCNTSLVKQYGNYYHCKNEGRYLCNTCFNDVEDRGIYGAYIVCTTCERVCYSD